MLDNIRKKQTRIVSGMIAIFLGSFLSLVCQNCLANSTLHQMDASATHDMSEHCMQMDSDEKLPEQSDSHCLGVCDHDDYSVISNDSFSNANDKVRSFTETQAVIISQDTLWNSFPLIQQSSFIGKPSIPDRACYSPLDRNCVLLN